MDYLSKVKRVIFSPGGLLALVLAGLALDPMWEALERRITASEMLRQIATATNGFVHNPIVDLAFMFLSLLFLARAAKAVANADDAREKRKATWLEGTTAERDAALQNVSRRQDQRLTEIMTRLDEMLKASLEVPAILARQKKLNECIEAANAGLIAAQGRLATYRQAVNSVREDLGMGASHATEAVRTQLWQVKDAVIETGAALGESIELNGLDDPEPVINEAADDETPRPRFAVQKNRHFLDAHDRNLATLEAEIGRLTSVASLEKVASAKLDRQIQSVLARFD